MLVELVNVSVMFNYLHNFMNSLHFYWNAVVNDNRDLALVLFVPRRFRLELLHF